MTIEGEFEGGSFSISDIDIDNNPCPGGNPTVTFTLKTDWGEETVTEMIFDGHLPRCDGAWIDRLETAPDEYEDREDLFAEVNTSLNPYVAHTGLSLPAVADAAAKMRLSLERIDVGDPLIEWALYNENERIFLGASLHEIQHELSRLKKAKRKI